MRTPTDLKGKYIRFDAPNTWKGCGERIEKVVKVTGVRKFKLTVLDFTGRKKRIDFERVIGVDWFGKIRPIDEWLNNGGD